MTPGTKKKEVSLVIGWGGVKCAAVIGVLRVLKRENINVTMVVGSGAGSLFGTTFALGHDVEELVELSKNLFNLESISKPNRTAILQLLLPKIFKVKEYFNLLDDRIINQNLKELLGDLTFEDTVIPLFITATNYKTGKETIFSTGSLYEAARASISMPLLFPPIEKDGQLLSDGFLSEPLPIGVAIREGAQIILAMGFETIVKEGRKNFSEYIFHLADILSNNMLMASTEFYRLAHHTRVISIVPHFETEIHLFDTEKYPEIIKVGEEEAEKILPELKRLLDLKI